MSQDYALRVYDYLVLARGRLLQWVRPLNAEQYVSKFPIGLGTLAQTLTHIAASEGYYVWRMLRAEVPPYEQWPLRHEEPPPFAELVVAWERQAQVTKSCLRSVDDWFKAIEYLVTNDEGQPVNVTTSAADLFTQLVLHEVHHRAQALNMLRRLGVATEDLDFNALMYQRRKVSG